MCSFVPLCRLLAATFLFGTDGTGFAHRNPLFVRVREIAQSAVEDVDGDVPFARHFNGRRTLGLGQ